MVWSGLDSLGILFCAGFTGTRPLYLPLYKHWAHRLPLRSYSEWNFPPALSDPVKLSAQSAEILPFAANCFVLSTQQSDKCNIFFPLTNAALK